jgi:beta-barrel assembly-enhancing protease
MRALTMAIAFVAAASAPLASTPADEATQLGEILKRAQQIRELQITDEEEQQLGAAVSERVRVRYGVVQDAAVHKYVSLVGIVLAQAGTRPNLPYQFIVLDTDGVNAFAAPGGYIHITRGALGLMENEAELAGVLAHELIHITNKHTIKAIQKSKLVQMGADETIKDKAVFGRLVDATTDLVMAGFGRSEELEADRDGLRTANRVGYDPHGLNAFLTRLMERNKSATEKQGLFASHPEMQERLGKISQQIAAEKLSATATVEARYRKFISYTARPVTDIAPVEGGAAGLTGGGKEDKAKGSEDKSEQPKKKGGFGLASLLKPGGSEKKSAEVVGSGASRGVDKERNAKGGQVSTVVAVTVTAADIGAFKKEGNLK